MKLICVRPCQVKGYGVLSRKEEIDIAPEEIDAHICLCFVDENGRTIKPPTKKVETEDGEVEDGEVEDEVKAEPVKTKEEETKEMEDRLVERFSQWTKDRLIATLETTKGASWNDKMTKVELAKCLLRAKGEIH